MTTCNHPQDVPTVYLQVWLRHMQMFDSSAEGADGTLVLTARCVCSPEGFPAPAVPAWLVSAHTWPTSQKLQSCLRWLLNKCPLKAVPAEAVRSMKRNGRVLRPQDPPAAAWVLPSSAARAVHSAVHSPHCRAQQVTASARRAHSLLLTAAANL